MTTSLCSQ